MAYIFFFPGSLLLLRMDWSRADREGKDQLGGDWGHPGEGWMVMAPPGAMTVGLEGRRWTQHVKGVRLQCWNRHWGFGEGEEEEGSEDDSQVPYLPEGQWQCSLTCERWRGREWHLPVLLG